MAEFLKGLKRNSLKIPELSEFFVSDFGDTSYKVALPRIEFNNSNTMKEFSHEFDSEVLEQHEICLNFANVIAENLVDRYENKNKGDSDQERNAYLRVEKVERHTNLERQAPEGVEARKGVHYGVCVDRHKVNDLTD